ncbi:fasciclin domain-containing protein [Niabella aquatica]
MKKTTAQVFHFGIFILLVFCCLFSCQKPVYRQTTTDEVNITGYLQKNTDTYSLLLEALERAKASGFLGAYGTYTLFAPTNDAMKKWMSESGKTSLSDFQDAELLNFVKYHIVRDTVGSLRFTDGKIKTPTLFGEYLYTDVLNGNFRVNKAAVITQANIACGNGIVHSINAALTPPSLSLAELIESNPRYAIFTQALKETGFYDTLYYKRGTEIPAAKRFQTVIAESDSVLKVAGITSYSQLKEKYSQTGNPKSHSDSLWLYVAYHISNGGNYLEDIASLSSIYTLAPKEIINTKLVGTKVLLNDDVFNGVYEPGAELNRRASDVTAVNGVLHESLSSFRIKVRMQVPVYFDIATSPELLQALGASYRNGSKSLVSNGQPIANSIGFEKLDVSTIGTNQYIFYSGLSTKRPYANGDLLSLTMCAGNAARVKYVDIKTPYLVKGKYKVWICYAQNGQGSNLQVIYNPGKADEQILPNIVFLSQTLSGSGVANLADPSADNLMLAQGYKRYFATQGDYNANGVTGGILAKTGDGALNVGRLAGTINVETTDRHTIRFQAVSDVKCGSNLVYLDMIHFIPADDLEQIYPRFHQMPGELFYRPR